MKTTSICLCPCPPPQRCQAELGRAEQAAVLGLMGHHAVTATVVVVVVDLNWGGGAGWVGQGRAGKGRARQGRAG